MEQIVFPAIMLLAVLVPAIGIPVHLGLRHERWKRELEHKERMRALELGRALPGDESWLSPARIGLLIGGGAPLGIFLCATLATAAAGFQPDIWIASGIVSLAAVISGSSVAGYAASRGTSPLVRDAYKPPVEEDAYDVVSARG
jgi:hypothetical protein